MPQSFRAFAVGMAAPAVAVLILLYGGLATRIAEASSGPALDAVFALYAEAAKKATHEHVWQSSIDDFVAADREHPPAPGGVVFVGSSSIRLWSSLESDLGASDIVKRGFGGSRMSDSAYFADRIVLPYRPRLVVVYAGDNDLAEGVKPQEVLASYIDLVRQVHEALPDTRVAFISIKPSPLREALMGLTLQTNKLIEEYSKGDRKLDYIDVYTKMLDSAGRPRTDLFNSDGLHLNRAGYAIWTTAIEERLALRTVAGDGRSTSLAKKTQAISPMATGGDLPI
jgi:lysophospholipase L1-like esterase